MERIAVVLTRLRRKGSGRQEGFMQLFVSKRLIHGLATAMLGLFVPIFLYETSGERVEVVALFYIGASLFYVLWLVPAMWITNRVGFSRVLALGMLFAVVHYVILLYMNPENLWYLFLPAVLTVTGFRLFHWVSYHVNFALLTQSGERGKSVSLMFAAIAFMSMIGPVLGGLVIETYGFNAMFGLAIVLLMLAGVSYLFIPIAQETFTWSYADTLRQLFSPSFRDTGYLELAYGAETIMNTLAWPLFIYIVLEGNVLEVGGITALIVLVTIGIQLLVGGHIDKNKDNSVLTLKRGSLLHALGWIFKMFVLTGLHVFIVGLYHNITRIFVRTPYSTILYDASGDQGHYIDEFTVIREMANHSGRVLALIAFTATAYYTSIETSFIIGIVACLFLTMFAARRME